MDVALDIKGVLETTAATMMKAPKKDIDDNGVDAFIAALQRTGQQCLNKVMSSSMIIDLKLY